MHQERQKLRSNAAAEELRLPLLRRTLLGEYLSLALIVHASFGCLAWGVWSFGTPAGLLMVAAGLWSGVRAAGIASGQGVAPFVTLGLIVSAVSWQRMDPAASASSPWLLSPTVFVAMLGVVACLDLGEQLASPVARETLRWVRRWNWHRITIWGFAAAFLTCVVLIPVASSLVEAMRPADATPPLDDELTLGSTIGLRVMEGMTAMIFFAFGATIGSFLNVVVFRMPRGESVVMRPSRCPRCETKIEGRDNVPIFGWLLLEGRCRTCQIPISPRYPIVETVCATIFGLLYFVELISGGKNIPVRQPNFYHGVVWIIFYTKWDLVALYLFHCFTLSTLLTWALVDVDRQRIPRWATCCVAGWLLVLPTLYPDLLPVPWIQATRIGFDVPNWLTTLLTSVLGGFVGAALGWCVSLVIRRPQWSSGHHVGAGMIIGLSVGWQAAFGIWLIALAMAWLVYPLFKRWSRPSLPLTALLLTAYLIHLIYWRASSANWWPSHAATPMVWAVWCVTLVALCCALRASSFPCELSPQNHLQEKTG